MSFPRGTPVAFEREPGGLRTGSLHRLPQRPENGELGVVAGQALDRSQPHVRHVILVEPAAGGEILRLPRYRVWQASLLEVLAASAREPAMMPGIKKQVSS